MSDVISPDDTPCDLPLQDKIVNAIEVNLRKYIAKSRYDLVAESVLRIAVYKCQIRTTTDYDLRNAGEYSRRYEVRISVDIAAGFADGDVFTPACVCSVTVNTLQKDEIQVAVEGSNVKCSRGVTLNNWQQRYPIMYQTLRVMFDGRDE